VLKAGSTILVPRTEASPEKDISPEVVDNAKMIVAPDVPDSRRIYVRVSKRDTLASIAQRNHVTVAQIKAWNNLRQERVAAGKSLQLNVPYKAVASNHKRSTRQVAQNSRRYKAAPIRNMHHARVVSNVRSAKKKRI
jgi:membrane-bound lytic murein transglycosylase D